MADQEFFRASDFSSADMSVVFRNLTSRTEELPGESVTVEELLEDGIVLGLPARSCNVNHNVQLQITRTDPERAPPLVLRATGKVAELEPADAPAVIRARIDFLQIDEAVWRTLLSYQAERQRAVTDFLNKARG
jgi:hypothetical protein